MSKLHQEIEELFKEIQKQPLLETLLEKETEKDENLKHREILLRFLNQQLDLMDVGVTVANFDQDLKDCQVFSHLLYKLTEIEDFKGILTKYNSNEEKAKAFLRLLKENQFDFRLFKKEDLLSGNELEMVAFVGKLFLLFSYQMIWKKKSEKQLKELEEDKLEKEKEIKSLKKELKIINFEIEAEEEDLSGGSNLKNQKQYGDIFSFTNVTEHLINSSTFLKYNIFESLSFLIDALGIENDQTLQFQKTLELFQQNEFKEFVVWTTEIFFLNGLVKIIRSHVQEKFTSHVRNLINIEISNFKATNEKELEHFFSRILEILKENKIYIMEINPVYKSVSTLFDQFLFISLFRTQITNRITDLLFDHSVLIESPKQQLTKTNLWGQLHKITNKIMPGMIRDTTLIETISLFFKQLGFNDHRPMAEQLVKKSKKIAFGKAIRVILTNILSEKSNKELKTFLNSNKNEFDETLFDNCYEIMKPYLEKSDFDFLCKAIDPKICRETSKKMANALFYLFDFFGFSLPLVQLCIRYEILSNKDKESKANLFKQNDMSSLLSSIFVQIHGQRHLIKILSKPVNGAINDYKENYSNKQNKDNSINTQFLKEHFHKLVDAVLDTNEKLPIEIKLICYYYQNELEQQYPGLFIAAVGSFLFLRYICPAIVSPENHNIVKKQSVSNVTRRILINLSQVIQKFALELKFNESTRKQLSLLNPEIEKKSQARNTFYQKTANIGSLMPKTFYKPFSKRIDFKLDKPIEQISAHFFLSQFDASKFFQPKKLALEFLIQIQKFKSRYYGETNEQTEEQQFDQFFGQFGSEYLQSLTEKVKKFSKLIENLHSELTPIKKIAEGKQTTTQIQKIDQSSVNNQSNKSSAQTENANSKNSKTRKDRTYSTGIIAQAQNTKKKGFKSRFKRKGKNEK
ncbi:inhibitory regulator protein ira1-related [Anaeramoeba flamelloides]|uniref:Inhibitory regulator protein ira1-related n=1 Tax=Anaeramoeba flamelloides TaxID=1746091 RepID=A0ABQ8YRW0_9EUKA|nr:inhibitory regulator protein ira1-related [Anaeramoeba flamelloides]